MAIKIAVQCGHGKMINGKWDPGAVYGTYTEAGLMLPIVKSAVKYLRAAGVQVISDSDTGNNKNIVEDVTWANREKVSLYVSVHCDYAPAPTGVASLYMSDKGAKLGGCINAAIVKGLKMKDRGLFERPDLYELYDTDMPAVILETGGIKADLALLRDKPVEYGRCIAEGICTYLGISLKGGEHMADVEIRRYKATRKINVYRDHKITSGKIGEAKKGSIYSATKWYKNDWCYIPYLKGWVPMKGTLPPFTYLEPVKVRHTVINRSGINIYAERNTKSKFLKNVKRGSHLEVTIWFGKWVYFPEFKGWGAKSCLFEGDRSEALVYVLKKIGKTMADNNFTYSIHNLKRNLAEAVKKDRRTDCAHYISFGYQELGVLPIDYYIWLNDKVNGNGASYVITSSLYEVTHPNKLPTQLDLKPGDTCGWHYYVDGKEGQHTMTLAEITADKRYLWMSAGFSDVRDEKYGPKEKPTYMNRPVNTLVRLK